MKTQLTILDNGSRTFTMTEPVSGRKPVLALLMRLLWAAALALPVLGAQGAVVFTTLHSFQPSPNVENPSGLVQGSDGDFFGTTREGGTNGVGTVFKINTNGVLTTLHSFTGGNDGAGPNGLAQGSHGNFYGTTVGGGRWGWGTVFKISTDGALTTLYSFDGSSGGANPSAALVQGSDGNFYGTTLYGGGTCWYNNVSCGTVFKISPNGALTTLYSFGSIQDTNGVPLDGANPSAALVQGSDGSFYGTTSSGGTNGGYGSVFKISTNGALTTLYSFTDTADGSSPCAALVQGSDGNFYGTTEWGGLPTFGTMFRISTNGVFTTLHSFTDTTDGCYPTGLAQGRDGSFYGTTEYGGTYYSGTVFKISPNGVLTTMHAFTGGNDGAGPNGLVQGSDGNFYGTTSSGGTSGAGTVFKISTNGVLTSLYSFADGTNYGANPSAALVQGSDGSFYGTTEYGGTYTNQYGQGQGTVFKISLNGALTTLHSFGSVQDTNGVPLDGANPSAALVQGSDGSFYGTTAYGGTYTNQYGQGQGTVFKISLNGALTTLHSFGSVQDTSGVPLDGANPSAALVQGNDGSFYGTTAYGGTYTNQYSGQGQGTVFRISLNGALTTLYSFGSVQDTNGVPLDGANPSAALVQGSDGSFYGTTREGGTNGVGTVFKISTNGVLTTLHSFTGGNDGAGPNGLAQGSDGSFYGTTEYNFWGRWGGAGNGTVFKISPTGAYASLYSFTGGNDGGNPGAGLAQASDGSFYGTTTGGGVSGAGTVFRLTIVPQPQLTIIPSEAYVILTWPANFTGFTLQSTANLGSSAVWTTNSSPPVVIGGENVVINTITGREQFYRLSQ
jgi:uncharacterized repeat protein (TIGR03803 family)